MIFSKLKFGKLYGVVEGVHEGQMLCFIEKRGDKLGFLGIPDMVNHWITQKDFDNGVKEGILEYIKKPPGYVKKVAKAQFDQNEKESEGV